VYGYACVPPTPFLKRDWERYDVSRYVDPGCVSPELGMRSVPVDAHEIRYGTIAADLERLADEDDLRDSVFLFHTPPYRTALDRAALDGRMVDHVPMDVHVGSIAVRRFIEERQPLLTLHGHIHESARLTGAWRDRIGRTHLFSAAHDGPELCLVRFDLENPAEATRALI
jgi:Icc-related predicted phosphoesterase